MARLIKALIAVGALGALALAAGLVIFAGAVRNLAPGPLPRADAIVVLTGSDDRIASGLELLGAGSGRRLLISGVHPANRTAGSLLRRIGSSSDTMVACCVDLDHEARNTVGNALNASAWVDRWGFRSVIVVTSSYHMPRSLAEFQRVMPGVDLVAHPVPSRYLDLEAWWLHRVTLRTLAGEYAKFLASTARLGANRVLGALEPRTQAERRAETPSAPTDARRPESCCALSSSPPSSMW